MPSLQPARSIQRNAPLQALRVVMSYDERILRRKRLVTESGADFMVDLGAVTSLDQGDAFVLDDGRLVSVIAAVEPVVLVRGNLPRLAWHIGNRHTPCQIAADHLVIRCDPVLEAMLKILGAEVSLAMAAFTPEGGAYGHGRTMGHELGGHDLGGHAHDPNPFQENG